MTEARPHATGILLVALLLCVLSTSSIFGEQVTIHLWEALPQHTRDVFLQIVDEFQAQNPDIKVEVARPSGGYVGVLEAFTVSLAGGAQPNIIHTAHAYTYSLRKLGMFMPIDDYVAKDPSFDLDDWYPPFIEAASMDGHLYGIPYNISVVSFYYNPYSLEASGLPPVPPRTWDDIISLGQRVTRDTSGDGVPDIWAMDISSAGGFFMEAWLGQGGTTTVNEARTEMVVNSPAGVRTYEFLQELIHVHGVARYGGFPWDTLTSGTVGWFLRSSADSRALLEMSRDKGVPLSLAPLPCNVQCYVPIGGAAFYAVDTGTQAERDATYKLLSFLGQPDNVARYAAASGYLATRRSALQSPYMAEAIATFPSFQVNYEGLAAYGHPETSAPEFARIQALFSQATPILRDNRPAKPILDEIARQGNAILAEFYERLSAQN